MNNGPEETGDRRVFDCAKCRAGRAGGVTLSPVTSAQGAPAGRESKRREECEECTHTPVLLFDGTAVWFSLQGDFVLDRGSTSKI